MNIISFMTVSSIAIILCGAPILFFTRDRSSDKALIMVLTPSSILYLTAILMYLSLLNPKWLHEIIVSNDLLGEVYGLIIDPMSAIIGFIVVSCGIIFLIYSMDYMTPSNIVHPIHDGKGRFYALMLLFMGSTIGFIHSSTLLGMIVFFELMSLSCWGLISYYGGRESFIASLKALLYTHIGAMLGLYSAITIIYGEVHDLGLCALCKLGYENKVRVFMLAYIAALSKSAQFPFYSWLPDAMVAPTPASAFLHGAAMIEMGVYLMARLQQFMNITSYEVFILMTVFAIITITICCIMYPLQVDSKRLLAYSTIAEVTTMYIALAYTLLGITQGLKAAILQIVCHAYIKGLGFLTAGVFGYCRGSYRLDDLIGLAGRSKIIAIAWISSLFGLVGMPPYALFIGKIYILSIASRVINVYTLIPIMAMLINSIAFLITALKWIEGTIFKGLGGGLDGEINIPRLMKYTIMVLITLSIVIAPCAYNIIQYIDFYEGALR